MSKLSTLKRAGYVSLALGMGLATTPLISAGNAFADEPCEGPTNYQELNNLINNWYVAPPELVTLCGNINGDVSLFGRQTTINLNGYTITATGQNALSATDWWQNPGKLTVVGDGNVNGGLNGNLDIRGGSYNNNPSQFVTADNLEAYEVGGRWIIDVDLDDFTAELDHKAVRVGNAVQITNNLSTLGSKSGVIYTVGGGDDSIISVSNSGKVTGMSEGIASVTVSPSFDPSVEITLDVSVYDIKTETEEDEAGDVVAGTLKELIDDGGLPKNPKDAPEYAKEVLGEGKEYRRAHEALRTAMGAGETITTAVEVDDEYEPTDEEVAIVEEALADYDVTEITYYDVSAVARDSEGWKLASLHKLNNRVIVALATTSEPAEGYSRQYLVVHIVNGEPILLTEGEDFFIEDGVLYLWTDEFSTFAVSYEDTLIPEVEPKAPETGVSTETTGSASANIVSMIAGAIATLTVAGAAVFVKRK